MRPARSLTDFEKEGNIGDRGELLRMAVDAGMAEATVRGLLEGPAAPTARALVLKTERALKHKYKITGVPHFIFDNKVAFSGAQDPSTFLEVFGDLADE